MEEGILMTIDEPGWGRTDRPARRLGRAPLVSALVAVTLLAVTLRGERSAWSLVVAWAAILGVNHRSGEYFAENRPDMTALMFAAAGVLLMGYGQERRRGRWVALGSACLVG